jgi:uncharacterized protein (TIGR02466 family)
MNNPNAQIVPLFATPLFVCPYEGDTNNLYNYLLQQPLTTGVDDYGKHSLDTYILDNEECKDLKDFVIKAFEDFATYVLRYNHQGIQLSQSWISMKTPGQFHTPHQHPNSVISGVFYFDDQIKSTPPIQFEKDIRTFNSNAFQPSLLEDYNDHPYSQTNIKYKPKPNTLLVFPSYLTHGVLTNHSEVPRFSLAINSLPKGVFGERFYLTELKYERFK